MRIWHGVTAAARANEYLDYVKATGVKMYLGAKGNRGVYLLRRIRDDQAEFYLLSLWDSLSAVRELAGPDVNRAVYRFPRDREFLLEMEPHVAHFEILVAPESERCPSEPQRQAGKLPYEQVLGVLAPCGLDCSRCYAHADGDIGKLGRELLDRLGSFGGYAERFSAFEPAFRQYPGFESVLSLLARGSCEGCRKQACSNAACRVRECSRQKGADFCFQCQEFPCEKSGLDVDLRRRWLEMNSRMKQTGVEAYYGETRTEPRYA